MQSGSHIYLEEIQFFSLAKYGDQLNRNFGHFLKTLSRFFLGIIAIVFLIPFAALLLFVTSIVSRIAFNQAARLIKKSVENIDEIDERTLMESVLTLEEISRYMNKAKKSVDEGGKIHKYYAVIFFGSGLYECLSMTDLAIDKINKKVYPDRNKELSSDQINELLKAYDGLDRV